MSFVLICPERRAYVAREGASRAYTWAIQNARRFPTRELAERERSETEIVVPSLRLR